MTDNEKRAPRAPKERSLHEPTAEQVREARLAAGLTQTEAGALVWFSEVAWAQWEAGRRPMHPCVWWAFQQRASVLAAAPKPRSGVTAAGIERIRESMRFDEIGVAVDFPAGGEKVAPPRVDFLSAGVVVASHSFVDVPVHEGMAGVRMSLGNLEGGFAAAGFMGQKRGQK